MFGIRAQVVVASGLREILSELRITKDHSYLDGEELYICGRFLLGSH